MNHWKVLIVDDEMDVHEVTRLTLKRINYENQDLVFISAISGEEAKEILGENNDIAVVLLDIVMENDDAGLDVVRFIRKELKNNMTQIIIRTGQPGNAPVESVTLDYEINDYQEKSELTSQKLRTSVITALRAYKSLKTIDEHRMGLKKVIRFSNRIFRTQSFKAFGLDVLSSLHDFFASRNNGIDRGCSGFVAKKSSNEAFCVAIGMGQYAETEGKEIEDILQDDICQIIEREHQIQTYQYVNGQWLFFFSRNTECTNLILIEDGYLETEWEMDLIETLRLNISIAFDNWYLNQEIRNSQNELFFSLGEIAESRSAETGQHVKRVGEIAKILGLSLGMSIDQAEELRMAASMHDLGKLTIHDSILNKPGKLTLEEYEIMKTHTSEGHNMLISSAKDLFKIAAEIAQEHHENYDGSGYPKGLKGKVINLNSRIVAVADVFDALGTKRVYKESWDIEQILQYMDEQKGKKFDPAIVEVFFQNIEQLEKVRDQYPDQE